eukprot:168057_1
MTKVTIKCGKKKHKNIEINPTDSFDDIQAIIFSLTGITVGRQKIIISGKKLETDNDVKQLIKNKTLITVMGSNANNKTHSSSNVKVIVDEQKYDELYKLSLGLNNLGNTCYLNAVLQCIKSVTELKQFLKTFFINNQHSICMASKLGKLLIELDSKNLDIDAITPYEFVQYFRITFPRFAARNQHMQYEQQDADEAFTEIISALRHDNNISIINELFEGEFQTTTVCIESNEEQKTILNEKFIKLQCFIDKNVNYITDGIQKGFVENIEKRSDKLGRNAQWKKTRVISKLPKYISVQLVRFYWKQNTQKNAKILRRVSFPEVLDVYDFCNDELKQSIERFRMIEIEKETNKIDSTDELLSGYYELCGI